MITTNQVHNTETGDAYVSVYDDSKVIIAHENIGVTSSKHAMEVFVSEKEMGNRIIELGFEMPVYDVP